MMRQNGHNNGFQFYCQKYSNNFVTFLNNSICLDGYIFFFFFFFVKCYNCMLLSFFLDRNRKCEHRGHAHILRWGWSPTVWKHDFFLFQLISSTASVSPIKCRQGRLVRFKRWLFSSPILSSLKSQLPIVYKFVPTIGYYF